jgi:hypothetical protein
MMSVVSLPRALLSDSMFVPPRRRNRDITVREKNVTNREIGEKGTGVELTGQVKRDKINRGHYK